MDNVATDKTIEDGIWNRQIQATSTPDEAAARLEAILSDRLLWFNPYRVRDRELLDCAERGKWLPFPSLTQMLVFHFHNIRRLSPGNGFSSYEGLFFHIGCSEEEHHFGVRTLCCPLTHRATRMPARTLVNGCHLTNSLLPSLERRDIFISHALICDRISGETRPAYRMHRLYGSDAKRASVVREAMCMAKLDMLDEVMRYAVLPEYLGNSCKSFDHITLLLRAMENIRRFPMAVTPSEHVSG